MRNDSTAPERFLRKADVIPRVGLSESTIYRLEQSGNFPQRYCIGPRAVAWRESEVDAWITARAAS